MSNPPVASGADPVLLDDHHTRLERVCGDLLSETYADDPRALCEQWRTFEQQLLDHMRAEEELILPAYESANSDEARAIRREHDDLRAVLHRLGLEVDLHQIRLHTVRELLDRLRAHADREDAGMYPWAAAHLPRPRIAELRARIERWLTAAARWTA